MNLCPNCSSPAALEFSTTGADWWRCTRPGCNKMFQRPAQTKSGSVNGIECIEAAGEIDATDAKREGGE